MSTLEFLNNLGTTPISRANSTFHIPLPLQCRFCAHKMNVLEGLAKGISINR